MTISIDNTYSSFVNLLINTGNRIDPHAKSLAVGTKNLVSKVRDASGSLVTGAKCTAAEYRYRRSH